MIETIDLVIIIAYFIFVLVIGFLFRKQVTGIAEYFRGGGKILWWMTGSSVFITTFSAWTFTGAARKAYEDGFPVMVIFIGNAIGYYVCARFLAGRFRQTRVDTPLEAYKQRYGRFNEQFSLWISFLVNQLPGGLTLVAVSIFVSAIFGWELQTTIIVTGLTVLTVTLTGGAWAVIASDFMQAMLIVAVTAVSGFYALSIMGGVTPIIEQFPTENILIGNGVNYVVIFVLWIVATIIQRLHDINNLYISVRFLAAKDSQHARRAAVLAACLFGLASLVWFLPPMVSAIIYPDLGTMYPNLSHPSEAAYLAFVDHLMPAGMLGLLVAAMFAATMSSMDSALAAGSAMLVKCVYKPFVRPRASEKEYLIAGRVATLVLGLTQIGVAVAISGIKGASLFELMLGFLGLFGLPLGIPAIMCFIFRRTPDWSAWSTVLFGFTVSFLVANIFNGQWFSDQFRLGLTAREVSDMNMIITYAAHLTLTVGWFLASTRFYHPLSQARQAEVDEFYDNIDTPVESAPGSTPTDRMQCRRLGLMTGGFGVFVCSLMFASSGDNRYSVFLSCGGILILIGALLVRAGRKPPAEAGVAPG